MGCGAGGGGGGGAPGAPMPFSVFSSNSLATMLPPARLAEAGVPARKYISEKFMMLPTCGRTSACFGDRRHSLHPSSRMPGHADLSSSDCQVLVVTRESHSSHSQHHCRLTLCEPAEMKMLTMCLSCLTDESTVLASRLSDMSAAPPGQAHACSALRQSRCVRACVRVRVCACVRARVCVGVVGGRIPTTIVENTKSSSWMPQSLREDMSPSTAAPTPITCASPSTPSQSSCEWSAPGPVSLTVELIASSR